MIQECISKLAEGTDLTKQQIAASIDEVVAATATPAQVGAFLVALHMKGETPDEIAAFASSMRSRCVMIHPRVNGRLIDTCGTGGDGGKTFNVSTIAAIVAAGAGVYVAKHGNRSVTSRSGSADLLEKLGFNIAMPSERVTASIEQIGIGFMFAPSFHPAMKQVAGVRRELGVRTIFNILGPIMNPADVKAQLLGVYSPKLTESMAEALRSLGREEALVVHGLDGTDEISVRGKTLVSWLKDRRVTTKEFSPSDFGVTQSDDTEPVGVSSVEESAEVAMDILSGRRIDGTRSRMVIANAGAAILLGGKAARFDEAAQMARESIRSGAAQRKLGELVRFSGGIPP